MTWSTVKLGTVAVLARDMVEPNEIPAGTPYVGLEHITSEGRFTNVQPLTPGEVSSTKYRFNEHHILYGKLRPYLNKVVAPDFAGVCSTEIVPLLPLDGVDRHYLLHFLRQPRIAALATHLATGANLPRLSPKKLLEFELLLPPHPEQRRIANILDKVDELRRMRQQTIASLESLPHTIFIETFGHPLGDGKEWRRFPFSEVLLNVVGGKSYGGEARPLQGDELGVLKVSAVTRGEFDPTEFKAVPSASITGMLVKPRKGDLLFSRANTRELVAATCMVDDDYDHLFLPDKLWRLDLDRTRVNPWYIKYLFSHDEFRRHITSFATGTSGSMLNISMEKLRALKIPLPPLELQENFAKQVDAVQPQLAKARRSLSHLDELFAVLQEQAFAGELALRDAAVPG